MAGRKGCRSCNAYADWEREQAETLQRITQIRKKTTKITELDEFDAVWDLVASEGYELIDSEMLAIDGPYAIAGLEDGVVSFDSLEQVQEWLAPVHNTAVG
jgi:hypothetical protein